MIPAGTIWLETGEVEQAYIIVTDTGIEAVTHDGLRVMTMTDKEFQQVKKEINAERGGDIINETLNNA